MAGKIICGVKTESYSAKEKNTGAYYAFSSCYPAAIVLPVRGLDLRSVSLIKSYVTSSVQLTIAFRAMFGAVPA